MDIVKAILSEYRIHNADISFRCDATEDQLIDVIEGNRIYVPAIYVLTKIDQITIEELDLVYRIPHAVPISPTTNGILTIYWINHGNILTLFVFIPSPKDYLPDYSSPFIMKKTACTVEDFL